MVTTLERPQVLLVAGLAALGAIVALSELLGALDRFRFAAVTSDELGRLPTTDERESE